MVKESKSNISINTMDKEFSIFAPLIDEDNYEKFVNNLIKKGPSPVFFWNDQPVFHLNEYVAYTNLKKSYIKKNLNFKEKENVLKWICLRELEQCNNSEYKKYLLGILYHSSYILKNKEKISVAVKIGSQYGLSYGSIYKYEEYSLSINKIAENNFIIAKKILNGTVKLSQQTVLELSRLSAFELSLIQDFLLSQNNNKIISYSDIKYELKWNQNNLKKKTSKKIQVSLPIKKLPQFDPDSEIAGISLTIPSWIESISRVTEKTNFSIVTNEAKKKFTDRLEDLKMAIDDTVYKIQEGNYE